MPLVLLHGIGTDPRGWRPQVEAFSRERRVLTPRVPLDLPRAGEELDALITEPADFCGLSFGALVALSFAVRRPERVRRLVVCAGFASLPRSLRVLQAVIATAVALAPRALVLRGLPEPEPDIDTRALARAMREGAHFDLREELRQLDVPALVLCGERDRPNLRLARELAALLPNARFEIVPRAGHIANLDNPDAFNRLLAAFLPPAA